VGLGFCFYSFHGVFQARATAVSAFAMALFMGQTSGSLIFAGVIAAGGVCLGLWDRGGGDGGVCGLGAGRHARLETADPEYRGRRRDFP
jgi:hypothetical protein